MRVICDLEANGLKPSQIWVICTRDISTGDRNVFYPAKDPAPFLSFAKGVKTWVGHNFLGYDLLAIRDILGYHIPHDTVVDTLVLSRLTDSTLDGHSLEDWGVRLKRPKLHTDIEDWSVFTPEMEERCKGDVETNYLLFRHLEKYLTSETWKEAFKTESYISYLCNHLTTNGFSFSLKEAKELLLEIQEELKGIDKELKEQFLPKVKFLKEVLPRATKFGTIAKNSIPKVLGTDLTPYSPDSPFSLIEYQEFNPGSPKQRIERLNEAGWTPYEKTKGHKDAEKALRELKRRRGYHPTRGAEITALEARLEEYRVYGWTTSEENLATLPDTAPPSAHKLAQWLLLNNRASTLETQWIANYDDSTGRIHGSFNHIGAWTQRMSHDRPNMGNVPKFDAKQPHKTPYSDRMRALWQASVGRYLVGVDAESIQLRILGHYINDPQFITALVSGTKEDGTDPHTLNQKALGDVCKSRDAAKTFIYAWLLGAGIQKVAAILGCSREEAQRANDNFINFYPGLARLREEIIPYDAARGYFQGLDGRFVRIWGDDVSSRNHFALAGYLQNGEAIIMKRAVQIWYPKLERERIPFWWVNFVHDEYQTEVVRDIQTATYVAETQADAIRQVGVDLGLNCPLAGSILNAHGNLAIGDNWMETH